MANPNGRPRVKNKYAWIVTKDGVQAVPVRMHQGVYKTFNYDTKTQKTTFYREVKSPVFDSLEEANKNAPKFIGFQEDIRGLNNKGADMFYKSKYGYEINADNELSVVEYRYNPASGKRTEGYRRYIYYDDGLQTPGQLAPGELFDTPESAIDDYKTNYAGGKKIDWNAFDESQADIAAREPSQAELDRAYNYEYNPRPAPGRILPEGEETVQDLVDWQDEQWSQWEDYDAEEKALVDSRQAQLDTAEFEDIEYSNRPEPPINVEDVKSNVTNNIDNKFNVKGMGVKVLDVVGKAAGPVDEILLWGAKQGLPKLFAGTALAGASSVVGTGLFYGWMAWTLGNLSIAAIKGAGKFAGEFGGDTMKALEAISNGEIPEKDWTDAFKESLIEGFGDFSNQMQYDPSVMLIDSVTEKVFGFNQTDPLIKTYQFGKQGIQNLFGGRK